MYRKGADRERERGKISTIIWSNFRFFKSHVLCFGNFFLCRALDVQSVLTFCSHTIHIFCVLWTLKCVVLIQQQTPMKHTFCAASSFNYTLVIPVTGTMLHVVNKIQRLIECQFAWIAISFVSVCDPFFMSMYKMHPLAYNFCDRHQRERKRQNHLLVRSFPLPSGGFFPSPLWWRSCKISKV